MSSPVWWEAETNMALTSGISSVPQYSLTVLLYLSAIKPFLYSTNVLTVPFHSSKTLSDYIPFKDTTVAANESIQTHSKKDPNAVRRTTVVITD